MSRSRPPALIAIAAIAALGGRGTEEMQSQDDREATTAESDQR